MDFGTPSRTLLRSIAAGAVLLAAAACSHSDRSSAGGDTQVQSGAAPAADTQAVASQPTTADQPAATDSSAQISNSTPSTTGQSTATPTGKAPTSKTQAAPAVSRDTGVSGYQAMGQDSSATAAGSPRDTASSSRDTVAVGDSSHIGKTGNRLEPTVASEQANAGTLSNQADSTRIRPPEDSNETVDVVSDSGAAAPAADSTGGAPEMARDTNSSLAQADTTAPEQTDTSAQAPQDSSTVQAQIDTTQQTEMAQQAPVDSAAQLQAQVDTTPAARDTVATGQNSEMAQQRADTAKVAAPADTSSASQPSEVAPREARIRPPEDSTELHGNVADQNVQADSTSSDVKADAAAVGAAQVQPGNVATGADAVALVTREGRRCSVVNDDAEGRDLASSPATLNPCGTGTMTLPRVQVEER